MLNSSPESRTFTRRQLLGLGGLTVAGAILRACVPEESPSLIPEKPTFTPTASPKLTDVPVTSTSAPAKEASSTPTSSPTAIPEELQKQLAAETAPVMELCHYPVEFNRTYEAEVGGVSVKMTIVLSNLEDRALEPVKGFQVARPDAVQNMAEYYLKMCWLNYRKNHSEAANIGFDQYLGLVKEGKGKVTLAVADESKPANPTKVREIMEIDPRNVILGFREGSLPVHLTQEGHVYLAKNKEGKLVFLSNDLKATSLTYMRDKGNTDGLGGTFAVNLVFSRSLVGMTRLIAVASKEYNDRFVLGYFGSTGIEFDTSSVEDEVPDTYTKDMYGNRSPYFSIY